MISLYNCQYEDLNFLGKLLIPLKFFFMRKHIYQKMIQGKYDVEIAFLEGPVTRLLSEPNPEAEKIAWIHNDISLVFGEGFKAKIKRRIDEKIYQQYEHLVFVSQENLIDFNNLYTMKNDKRVIYNYIDKENVLKKTEEPVMDITSNVPVFVSVARLVEQKAIDRLIRIHAELIQDGYFHKIYVIGDGPLKEELEKQIQLLNCKDTFILLGKKENPYPYMKQADYFCLLSKFEGYGMVLEEAKILDKFIIITSTAAREAVQDYEKKLIVANNEEGIYKGLKQLIVDPKQYREIIKTEKYDNYHLIEEIIDLVGD